MARTSPRLALLALGIALAVPAHAATWHVNNKTGRDTHDGNTPQTAFATIRKATTSAHTSDTLVLANTGIAYREAIVLSRLGGTPSAPFIVEGNGATITGLLPIKPAAWQPRDGGLYFFPVPKRPYGFPALVCRGQRLPAAKAPDAIEPGQFLWDKQGILYRPEAGKAIADTPLEATLIISGLTVSSSSYIVCRNLISEFHSNDGFNIHGDCRGITCENIVGRHNGDDGFSIHEAIGSVVRNGHFHHNRWGIQDVNASRSIFNGITAEHNRANGVNFVGGYHSLVDSIVRDNAHSQIAISGDAARHLVGSEHNPMVEATVFLQNVVVTGGPAGLSVARRSRVTAWNCIFTGCGQGVVVAEGGTCHLAMSIIAGCTQRELDSASKLFFRDHNLYHPGRFRWLGQAYTPDQWDAFRAAAGHDANSLLADPLLADDPTHHPTPASPALKPRRKIGPTAPVTGYQQAGVPAVTR